MQCIDEVEGFSFFLKNNATMIYFNFNFQSKRKSELRRFGESQKKIMPRLSKVSLFENFFQLFQNIFFSAKIISTIPPDFRHRPPPSNSAEEEDSAQAAIRNWLLQFLGFSSAEKKSALAQLVSLCDIGHIKTIADSNRTIFPKGLHVFTAKRSKPEFFSKNFF